MIFVGRILKVDTVKMFPDVFLKYKWSAKDSGLSVVGHLVTLKLKQVYKGISKAKIIYVMTGEGGGDCGYYFNLKTDYIVYANKQDYHIVDSIDEITGKFTSYPKTYLSTTICDRTTNAIREEIALLRIALAKHVKMPKNYKKMHY